MHKKLSSILLRPGTEPPVAKPPLQRGRLGRSRKPPTHGLPPRRRSGTESKIFTVRLSSGVQKFGEEKDYGLEFT